MAKYLNSTGLSYVFGKIKNWVAGTFVPLTRKVNGKSLSSDIELDAGDIEVDASSPGWTVYQAAQTIPYNSGNFSLCTTSANDPTKVCTVYDPSFWGVLDGTSVIVRFQNSNTASDPTLNVNDTGDFDITYMGGNPIDPFILQSDQMFQFCFNADLGVWEMIGVTVASGGGGVTGVKGNAESSYRTGNVNITPANIGAAPSDISSLFTIQTVDLTASGSISANTSSSLQNKTLTPPTGKTKLLIAIPAQLKNHNFWLWHWAVSDNTVYWRLHNGGSSAASVTPTAYCIWV